jgi:hypothetical protein
MLTLGTLTLLIVSARPHCGAENVGQIWPDAANHDSGVLLKLAREGHLRICSLGLWKYQWESPTVSLRQMEDPNNENWRGKRHGLTLTKR